MRIPGFRREGVLLAAYDLSDKPNNAALRDFTGRLSARLRTAAWRRSAAMPTQVPLDIHGLAMRAFTLEGHVRKRAAPERLSSTISHAAIQYACDPLRAGQDFSRRSTFQLAAAGRRQRGVRAAYLRAEPIGRRLENRIAIRHRRRRPHVSERVVRRYAGSGDLHSRTRSARRRWAITLRRALQRDSARAGGGAASCAARPRCRLRVRTWRITSTITFSAADSRGVRRARAADAGCSASDLRGGFRTPSRAAPPRIACASRSSATARRVISQNRRRELTVVAPALCRAGTLMFWCAALPRRRIRVTVFAGCGRAADRRRDRSWLPARRATTWM